MALASQPRQSTRHATTLEKTLRLYRTEQAYMRAVPASTVFGDRLLTQISSTRPTTLKQLHAMKGIGAARFENYGRDIIRLINLNIKSQKRRTARNGKTPLKPVCLPPRPRPKPRPRPRPRPARKACVLPKKATTQPVASVTAAPSPPTSVYILELEDDRVYVGSSTNVERRIAQHLSGNGSAFTRLYKPTGVRLPRLGNVNGDGDAAERDETLRYMYLKGIPMVRGWKFTQVIMPFSDFAEAEANIRELFDLCRRCGRAGHFMTKCNATVDRWGRACTECV